MNADGLTERQVRILVLVDNFRQGMNRGPTYREIGRAFGIRAPTAWEHIQALTEKGMVNGSPDMAYSLKTTKAGEEAAAKYRRERGLSVPDDPRPRYGFPPSVPGLE